MGLTIGYRLQAYVQDTSAFALVRELHGEARRLPFDDVSPLEIAEGDADDAASTFVELDVDGDPTWVRIPALRASWFGVSVSGAETAIFGLGLRPATVEHGGRILDTGVGGRWTWSWGSKTQYASLPEHGGLPNFLRAHVGIVLLLDRAADLGIDVDVSDDSGYWEHRSRATLVAELERWNGMVAALGKWAKEQFPEAGEPVMGYELDVPWSGTHKDAGG